MTDTFLGVGTDVAEREKAEDIANVQQKADVTSAAMLDGHVRSVVINSVIERMRKRQAGTAMIAWKHMIREIKDVRMKTAKVIQRIKNMAAAAALARWVEFIAGIKATRDMLKMGALRIQKLTMGSVFMTWHTTVVDAAQTRIVGGKVVRRIQQRALSKIFDTLWMNRCEEISDRERQAELAAQESTFKETEAARNAADC